MTPVIPSFPIKHRVRVWPPQHSPPSTSRLGRGEKMSQRHQEPLAVVQELGELPTSPPSALGATLAVPMPLQTPIPGPKSVLSIPVSGSAGQPQLQSFVPCHPLQRPSPWSSLPGGGEVGVQVWGLEPGRSADPMQVSLRSCAPLPCASQGLPGPQPLSKGRRHRAARLPSSGPQGGPGSPRHLPGPIHAPRPPPCAPLAGIGVTPLSWRAGV